MKLHDVIFSHGNKSRVRLININNKKVCQLPCLIKVTVEVGGI